ncbi:HET-domain-containing protein [Stipitochalara longipes BDJ]|nr:HET-domain-containing protein [Stipitochalara longipes BDJ]
MLCEACEKLTIERLYTQALKPVPKDSGWNQAGYLVLHHSYDALEAAGAEGCENCQAFHARFVDVCDDIQALRTKIERLAESQNTTLPIIAFLHTEPDSSGKSRREIHQLYLQVGTGPRKPGIDQLSIAFRICVPREYLRKAHLHEFRFRFVHIHKDLGSDENFGIVRDWIHECCDNHSETCPPIGDNDLPTRLIDVGPADGSEEPRLVQLLKGEKDRYLALSHCWGVSTINERLTTTLATLDLRLDSIPMSAMPANFYDATIITRKLGYRYLWIDSLCIIQDSTDDWEIESQNMGNIYRNASLTIAAAGAKDSDGGMLRNDYRAEDIGAQLGLLEDPSRWFLQDRRVQNLYQFSEAKSKDKNVSDAVDQNEGENPVFCHLKMYGENKSEIVTLEPWFSFSDKEENWYRCTIVGPLGFRGWCLQERVLSHRILYYGVRQIYWQCASSRNAADGETLTTSARTSFRNLGSEATESPDLLRLKRLHARHNTEKSSLSMSRKFETTIYRTWHSIIFAYVNRRLTKQTDKLPALMGMARIIHELTGDIYVAGFWRRNLLVSLIWTHTASSIREYDLQRISASYYMEKPQWEQEKPLLEGPSWSWASADFVDRIDFWADRDEIYAMRVWIEQDAKILDVKTNLVGQSEFGRVKSGRLTIRGFTYPRWDVRTSGWDPMDFFSSWIFGFCPQSPWNRIKHEMSGADLVLWDYWPRQKLSPITRMLHHFGLWLICLFRPLFWQGLHYSGSGPKPEKPACLACMKYLCVHILSIVDRNPSEAVRFKSGNTVYEVTLWSLILEPVSGEETTYRRVGIAGKVVYVSEEEYRQLTDFDRLTSQKEVPTAFSTWKLKTVTII